MRCCASLYATTTRFDEEDVPIRCCRSRCSTTSRPRQPRVLFVGYGETDNWAHQGRYDLVLDSAHRFDDFVQQLWKTMQAMPQYRGSTTFIITTDHGRGSGLTRVEGARRRGEGLGEHLDRGHRTRHARSRRAHAGSAGDAGADRGDRRGPGRQGLPRRGAAGGAADRGRAAGAAGNSKQAGFVVSGGQQRPVVCSGLRFYIILSDITKTAAIDVRGTDHAQGEDTRACSAPA